MSSLNLVDLINLAELPLDNLVVIRHSFNKKETSGIWDKYDRSNFYEYQSIQPSVDFFKNRKYVLSFIADGKTHSRFVGCFEILGSYPTSNVEKLPSFPHQDFYDKPGHIYFKMQLSEYMKNLIDRLVIDWGAGTIGYVQYSLAALQKKTVVSIYPDSKHVFPGYNRVVWDFKTMQDYLTHADQYEEIANALKEVYAIYLVVDSQTGKYYVGSAYGKNGLFGRWLTYATTNGTGGGSKTDEDGNKGIVEYLKENPNAYPNFQYSILEVIHKTGINEKDIQATLDAEKVWKQKLCTLKTAWGLNIGTRFNKLS